MSAPPDIKIEISSDSRFAVIVADRFDVGVCPRGDVAKGVIDARIAPDMRTAVTGNCWTHY